MEDRERALSSHFSSYTLRRNMLLFSQIHLGSNPTNHRSLFALTVCGYSPQDGFFGHCFKSLITTHLFEAAYFVICLLVIYISFLANFIVLFMRLVVFALGTLQKNVFVICIIYYFNFAEVEVLNLVVGVV